MYSIGVKFKNSTFLRGTVKLCFEELGHTNLTAKNCSLSCLVLSLRRAKKFAHHSISASDLRKYASFGTLGYK